MTGVVTNYEISSAPRHVFSMADIGKEFVRTSQCCGDWCFTLESSDISKIRDNAVTLAKLSSDYLEFREKEPLAWRGYVVHKFWKGLSPNWDDGRWISIDTLIQGLSKGTFSINPICRRHNGCDDWH